MRRTNWQIFYAVDMGIACTLSCAVITQLLVRFVDEPTKLSGDMSAVVATVFVFRESRASTPSAGIEHLVATCVSFTLCLALIELLFGWRRLTQAEIKLRAKGMLCPSQANILETEVTSATRLAEFMFDQRLAQVERPRDVRAWIEGQLYKPENTR